MGGLGRALLIACATASAIESAGARTFGFYQGRTVSVVVGFTPGGGYDAYGRLIAQYLGKYIPGNPKVIVRNMPGAGSLTAVRSLAATQPQDGTIVATFNPGLITRSIVQPNRVKLDLKSLAWVGVAAPNLEVCYGYDDKGPKTWAEMMRGRTFILGSTIAGSGNYIDGAIIKDVFGAPVKEIVGFPGSAEQRIAIEQGELNGGCGSFSSIPAEWLRDDKAHVFVRFTKARPPALPAGAAFIGDYAKTGGQRRLLALLDADNEVGRPFIMSSRVPRDRLETMRAAFNAAMQDPGLLAQAAKEQLPLSPISGRSASEAIANIATTPPDVIARARAIFQ